MTKSTPMTMVEYMEECQARSRLLGFAPPTNPEFFEEGYSEYVDGWKDYEITQSA